MTIDVQRSMDFGNARKLLNVPNPVNPGDAANMAYVDAKIEGLAWKDSVRVATQSNVNLASPGAALDGVTMSLNDRFLAPNQTTTSANGVYIWNGAAVAATRALDANTAAELEQAIVTVEEGTSAGASYRQTQINITLDSDPLLWASFGATVGPASTSSLGTVQIATQSEVNAGSDALKPVTPATLASSVFVSAKATANIGDASATSYTVTHNLGTRDVDVTVYRNSGNYDQVLLEIQRPTVNSIVLVFDTAPALNAYRVKIST